MRQLTKEEAISFANSNAWNNMTDEQIAKFQIAQDKLCVPFDRFHKALEKTLGRPVFTHEIAMSRDGIMKELFEGKEPPSLQEVIGMVPEDMLIIFGVDK